MKTWIALLRGINVGGKNKIAMKALRELLEELGYADVRTYIQSGNCLFRSTASDPAEIAGKIALAIDSEFNFKPYLFILSYKELNAALADNPCQDKKTDPKRVHFFFLDKPAVDADLDALEALAKDNEKFALKKKVFYLHAPDGIGRSKLAAGVEKHLGVPLTARNLATVKKISEMAEEIDD